MEFNGVFHQAYDNYCYPINEDELIINIKTGYDVKEVNIILGDPFLCRHTRRWRKLEWR